MKPNYAPEPKGIGVNAREPRRETMNQMKRHRSAGPVTEEGRFSVCNNIRDQLRSFRIQLIMSPDNEFLASQT
jgi:hypothetical protein